MAQLSTTFAKHIWQIYQEIGDVHGQDGQKLFREAVDGLFHEVMIEAMLATADDDTTLENVSKRRELSHLLDDFVANGSNAEVVLSVASSYCAQERVKSVSDLIGRYLEQQKKLIAEIGDPAEREQFQQRYLTLLERAQRDHGMVLGLVAEKRARRTPLFGRHGEA